MKVLSVFAPKLLQSAARESAGPATVEIHTPLLAKNDDAAERNRAVFRDRKMLVLNLISSPGSGKTELLSKTMDGFDEKAAVLVGDLETDNDARRIHRPGVPVAQITTGTACHLDAEMIARGMEGLDLDGVRVLFIENVGNLVCPAEFDLGEKIRVVLLSVTEGEDKPLKYPPIFKSADLVLLTKTDVAGALGFDRQAALSNIARVAPQAEVIELSARSGEGLDAWYGFLRKQLVGNPEAAPA
ncbi:hydrogenase nickel incorporation protein HypB [Haloferula sp. A504]|uniref:hydrogenase nickel incorporation protein HypB n=1 Tax=Haloferula sp. A504 TaxID=3373601 RepID=UPI0031CAE781|nr:hydrogenase nickel incorporation protein HypB [Verrucomicrobiaceae bacterium E54]